MTGLCAWGEADGQETHTVVTYNGDGIKNITTTDPAGGTQVTTTEHGHQSVSVRRGPADEPAGATTTVYDLHGRVAQTVLDFEDTERPDAVTDYTYDDLDRLETQTDPEPNLTSPDFGRRVTTTRYDHLSRVVEVEHPNANITYTSYLPTGEVEQTFGFGVNPVRYEYDSLGRLWKLKTYKDASGDPWTGEAVTTWNYHSTKGTLTSKTYNGGGGPAYLYEPSGRLLRKTNQRGIQANYTYTSFGEVESINYSDATQDVAMTYDRLGRLKTVKDAAGERTFTYDDGGRMLTEEIATATGAGNLLSGVTVTNTYDSTTKLRTAHNTAKSTLSKTVNYGYDSWRRLDHVQKDTLHARFEYDNVTGQVKKTTYVHDDENPSGHAAVTGAREFDRLGRLTALDWTTNTVAANTITDIAGFGYEHDEYGRRNKMNLPVDGTFWNYDYDSMNQLTSASHQKLIEEENVQIPGETTAYIYDHIGNRQATSEGGGEGQTPYTAGYTSNLLNQYTARDVPEHVEVVGRTSSDSINGVTVNTESAWLEGGIYAKRVTFDNSTDPVLEPIQVSEYIGASLIRTSWWDAFLPKDPESFYYDADGNLALDGIWAYEWDAENRLTRMQMRDEAAEVLLANSSTWVAIDFAYDWMGRRISKVYQTSASDPSESGGKYGPPILWSIDKVTRYVYDGWHLSMSYHGNVLSGPFGDQSFAWGPDLSGGYGGAGGIGGLVAYTDDEHDALNPSSLSSDDDFLGPMFPIYDGNGNVVKMVRFETAGSGAPFAVKAFESAAYEYGPFGENRSTTGELGSPAEGGTHQGQRNPFRFSTKFTDAETALLYYGYRYYSPSMGRWINRDPIEEADSANLYAFVGSDPTNRFDALGQYAVDFHYYVIYYLFKLKCYPDDKAWRVAWYSQDVDDHPLTNPLRHGLAARINGLGGDHGVLPVDTSLSILRDYHFWGSSQHVSTKRDPSALRSKVRQALSTGNLAGAGRWLHTYADSWSHEAFTAYPVDRINRRTSSWLGWAAGYMGHADAGEGGHFPDNPYNDADKAASAAANIYRLIPTYKGKDKDCRCESLRTWDMQDAMNELYRMFLNRNPSEVWRSLFNAKIIRDRFGSAPDHNVRGRR